MAPGALALFDAFPSLRRRLPRHALLSGPTPVQALELPGAPPGSLYVKRDERSTPFYGGSKPRKLEFVLGAALARGSRRLLTGGGLGTHHGLATTIFGRRAGLSTTLVLVRQPLSDEVRRSLLLFAAWGAELVWGGTLAGALRQGLRALVASRLRGERPFLVRPGGSSPLGNAGLVSAGLELCRQVKAGEAPEPAELWIPVGTGGTLAGLLVGLRLGGLGTRITGVLATDLLAPSPRSVARAARATLARLRRMDPAIPDAAFGPGDFDWVSDQLGPGYGASTPAAEAAVRRASEAGLALETTYTGKCLAALLERVRRPLRGPLLLWNTHSAVDTEATAPNPLDPSALPPRFREILGHGA